jgi:hypothetical protein
MESVNTATTSTTPQHLNHLVKIKHRHVLHYIILYSHIIYSILNFINWLGLKAGELGEIVHVRKWLN